MAVRAVADGVVVFAGVDEDGAKQNRQLTPEAAAAIARLGEEVARTRAHKAYDCWRFLDTTLVRGKDDPVIEDRYDVDDEDDAIASESSANPRS